VEQVDHGLVWVLSYRLLGAAEETQKPLVQIGSHRTFENQEFHLLERDVWRAWR